MKIKKVLISLFSLLALSSLDISSVSARHIYHHHYRPRIKRLIRLGGTDNIDDEYNHIYKLVNYWNSSTINYKDQRRAKSNLEASRLIKEYWNYFTPKQQLNLVKLNVPIGKNSDDELFDKMNNDVSSSQYGLNKISNQGSPFLNQIRDELIKDINGTRIKGGIKPLKVTTIMQDVSNEQAPRIQYAYDHFNDYLNYPHDTSNPSDNWVHGVDTNDTDDEYLQKQGLDNMMTGNNASDFRIDNSDTYADGTPTKYNNLTPKNIADNINDDLINHDMGEGNNNGHQMLEYTGDMKYLGVSVTYNPQTNMGSVNEEYGHDVEFL